MPQTETAVLGTGCFWCTEAIFNELNGVVKVTPGYAGGQTPDPTYETVAVGRGDHAEVAKIEFDPDVIAYNDLLEIFWHVHDPTSLNRQGADIGPQYRSLILYANDSQKQAALKSKAAIEAAGKFEKPIVTEIVALDKFYPAEDYHQKYYANHKNALYCQIVIDPKLEQLRQKFTKKLKPA